MPSKILVIDDEPDMLYLLRMILEDNTDHVVETTNSPGEGLHLFMKGDFDLVITDLKMPGMDGLDLFDEFKESRPHVPVIIITAYGSPGAATEALQKGVADFITKPFKKDSILFTVKRALELAEAKKENLELRKKLQPDPTS
jgi:DNA-binding NtrC family response regulator